MNHRIPFFRNLCCGTLLSFSATIAIADEAEPPKTIATPPQQAVNLKELLNQPGAFAVELVDDETIVPVGKHWLGVECDVASPALRTQLGLKSKSGIVVVSVAPDGPAKKAGIADYDLLLEANGEKLADVPDLMQAIHAADGKAITLKLLRGGKEKTIEVQPAERPQGTIKFFERALPPGGDKDIIMKWFNADGTPGDRGELPRVMKFAKPAPGVLMLPGKMFRPPLPDDVTVTIERTGNKPAKIIVKRGDEKWETDDEHLDKLPKDVRPLLMPFGMGLPMPGFGLQIEALPAKEDAAAAAARAARIAAGVEAVQPPAKPTIGVRVQAVPAPATTMPLPGAVAGVVVASPQSQPNISKQLDEINRRLERIEKAILGKQAEDSPGAKR